MPRPRRLRVDPRKVVHETIDGETILIHLDTGTYYSLNGTGPEIWALLADGVSDDDVVAEMQRRHAESPEVVADATRGVIRRFTSEELLEELEPNGTPAYVRPADAPSGLPFEAPVLERYTDMQYFLLLDPIHEVEEAGWPHERPAESQQAG